MAKDFSADVAAVGRIEMVPTLLDVVCRTTGMGFAAIARVTSDRWIACAVKDDIAFGLQPGGELTLETTICAEIKHSRQPVVINNVSEDPVYSNHRTPKIYGFQSYISVPIILPDGTLFGTLCAIDPRPARVNSPEIIGMFKLFAELIAFHLSSLEQLTVSEANLSDEREASALREQFIAVLGHDLRNPLAAIDAGMQLLERTPLNAKALNIAGQVKKSVWRMAALVDDIMDLARGRLGGGLPLDRGAAQDLQPVLAQIVDEMRASAPDRVFELDIATAGPVDCDRRRIGQLFSNLLGNAVAYGAGDQPIRASATADGKTFQLAVSNAGAQIPPATLARLFQPFARGAIDANQQGLGLGLYICSEIAKAHGGTLEVTSAAGQTCFTLRMPLHSASPSEKKGH